MYTKLVVTNNWFFPLILSCYFFIVQRVLENCDVKTQSIMLEEILQSVTTLALDQYGNYVVQVCLPSHEKLCTIC